MQRPSAAAVARTASRTQKLPRDVVILLVVLGVLVLGGLVALFLPYAPTRGLRILGTIDQPRPSPPATATPRPTPSPR